MLERIEKLLDQYCFGSGTRSRRPEEEVAELIKNGAFILDVRTGLEAKKGTARERPILISLCSNDTWTSCRVTGRS